MAKRVNAAPASMAARANAEASRLRRPAGAATGMPAVGAADIGAYEASSQDPTLIGELGFSTRSMLRKRVGRPRSCTRAAPDRLTAMVLATLLARASAGRPLSWAAAATTDEAPARPPKK